MGKDGTCFGAKNCDLLETLIMCRILIAISVQCQRNKRFIDKIQSLSENNQHQLRKPIEQVHLFCDLIYLTYFTESNILRERNTPKSL